MKKAFQHLLLIQQHSPDDLVALDRAITLAHQHHSRLTVFKSFYKKLPKMHYDTGHAVNELEAFLHQQQQEIRQQVAALTSEKLQINIVISWQEKEKLAIAHLLQQLDISLLITLQHKRRGLLALLSPGLEHYLINNCDLPVWLVKPSNAEQEMNILACLDVDSELASNTALNDTILHIGRQLSARPSDQLHIINCYNNDTYSMSMPYSSENGFEPLADIAKQHISKLQPYLRQYKLPANHLHLNEGLPDDEIPKAVQQLNSQLAIIGNNHTHTLGSALLGDTAHYLSKNTPCDVLVVKPMAG